MFDYSKLRGLVIEKFHTRKAFAEAMGMTASAISDRLMEKRSFKSEEIIKAKELLGIKAEELEAYFFTPKVR